MNAEDRMSTEIESKYSIPNFYDRWPVPQPPGA